LGDSGGGVLAFGVGEVAADGVAAGGLVAADGDDGEGDGAA
jgi:hypothetical protein